MKIRILAFPFAAVAALAAADAPPASPDQPGRAAAEPGRQPRHERHEGRGDAGVPYGRLLEMDDARLARLRLLIERVEKIPAPERAALYRRLQAAAEASPAEREALHRELREKIGPPESFGRGRDGEMRPPEGKPGEPQGEPKRDVSGRPMRDLLEKHFSGMPPERAKAEKEKFLAMPREQKMAYLKELRAKYGHPAPETPPDGESMVQSPKPPQSPAATKSPDRDDPFRRPD